MRGIKILFVLSGVVFSSGCSGNKNTEPAQGTELAHAPQLIIRKDTLQSSIEDKIIDAVLALPEVEAASARIDSFSNHQHGIATMMDPPEEGKTDYSVRVGYNGDERFEVYYFFEVNPVTLQVKIMDVDTFIPVEEWRNKKEKK
ncbi:MAG: hypothetical protein ACXVPN_03670 [Bacteroidia bacterium]